jgi:UDP-3-O-[3-hydroxymyristoyl] glucosamine N-acyltransferase
VQLTAGDIAQIVGGELSGNPGQIVTGVAGVREAQPGDLTFIANPKYAGALRSTRAAVVIVGHDIVTKSARTLVRVNDPMQAFTTVVQRFVPPPVTYETGVHPTAVVAPTARLGRDVSIQSHVVIEPGAVIGDRTVLGAGSYIGHQCRLGNDCLIYPHVTLREHTEIGDRVILHSGVVLGADGFGYETSQGRHRKIPQVGHVEIGDDVEIGANSTIDRGRFGKTVVGNGTKISNLVEISHNCRIGEHCLILAGVGIAGSVIVGDRVTLAGQVGVAGHLTIGDDAVIKAKSGISKNVPAGASVFGAPAVPDKEYMLAYAHFLRLPKTVARLRELEQLMAKLRADLDSTK